MVGCQPATANREGVWGSAEETWRHDKSTNNILFSISPSPATYLVMDARNAQQKHTIHLSNRLCMRLHKMQALFTIMDRPIHNCHLSQWQSSVCVFLSCSSTLGYRCHTSGSLGLPTFEVVAPVEEQDGCHLRHSRGATPERVVESPSQR